MASTAQLAAQEYRLGVSNGRVVAPQEVAEAALFLKEARRAAAGLGSKTAPLAGARIDSLISLVADTASPDTVDSRVRIFTSELSSSMGVTLDEPPVVTPSLARGADIFRAKCAGCHGGAGQGDGSLAANLDPPPANLADWEALKDQTPLDYFRRIGIGTVGTAMPAFEEQLPLADRWAVALYASTLRLPRPAGDVPASLRAFPTTGKLSDDSILAALGVAGKLRARLSGEGRGGACVRQRQREAGDRQSVRSDSCPGGVGLRHGADGRSRGGDARPRRLHDLRAGRVHCPSKESRRRGRGGGGFRRASDERGLGNRDAGGAQTDREPAGVSLEKAERVLGDDLSPVNLFVQSFVILLREGLEAILIVGALMTFLSKMGASHRKREIHLGVGAAVVASVLTAFALETIFVLSPARREGLEGATMLVATGRALLRELLAALEDGSGQVEPFREEQGRRRSHRRLGARAGVCRLSRRLS